jgi:hypothetical protein
VKLGTLNLKPGPATLTLEALSLPGIDLKHLKLTRRSFQSMKRLILILFALCPSLFAAQPNILFAIADDWGLHAGAYGTSWVNTPNFDRVAREGLLFRNAYTPIAKCAPSRAISRWSPSSACLSRPM